MNDQPISELAAAIIEWAVANGAEKISDTPGLWHGETDEWTVEANGHREAIDGLPFAHIRLTHKRYLQIAVLSPFGGIIGGGADEDAMIEHFREASS